jgi:hypothetical protein
VFVHPFPGNLERKLRIRMKDPVLRGIEILSPDGGHNPLTGTGSLGYGSARLANQPPHGRPIHFLDAIKGCQLAGPT